MDRGKIFLKDSTPKAKYIALATRCGILFILITSLTLASGWCLVYEAKTPMEHSKCILHALGGILLSAWYSTLMFQANEYAAVMVEVNSIVEKREVDPTVNLIYENTRTNIEWMTKKLFFVIRIFGLLYDFVPAIVSFFKYITSGFSNESFLQAYPASYPFDWKNPLGYVACVFIQLVTVMVSVETYVSGVILTVGFCMALANFASDIKEKLRQFNQNLISLEREKHVLLVKKLNGIIEFYSEARDLSIALLFANRFSDVNSFIVFACPVFTIAVFGDLISQVNLLMVSGDIVDIVQITIALIGSFLPFLTFCLFGGKITQKLEDIGHAVYQLEWYRLPLNMQKDLGVVIALAQKRIHMRGYGDTRTTHSVFKKILKNKFYYFMLTRKI